MVEGAGGGCRASKYDLNSTTQRYRERRQTMESVPVTNGVGFMIGDSLSVLTEFDRAATTNAM